MKKLYVIVAAFSLFLANCASEPKEDTKDSVAEQKDVVREKALSMFAVLPEKAENPENILSEAKITLGKMLYFDTRLSKDGKNSCNTCHNLETFGVDNLATSPGDLGKNGTRNSPTVFNAALHTTQFWDGREPNVEAQAGGPVLNPVEMNMPSEKAVVDRLKKVKGYVELFKAAFAEDKDPVTYANMKKAIGAFERTLLTPSKFDKYLAGENVFSDAEKKGLETFMNTGCVACHRGATLGGDSFQKFVYNGKDKGRFDLTKDSVDMYMFKTASLRNVEKTSPYFHDGGAPTLEDAVKIMGKESLKKDLTDAEVAEIATFLKTLTGDIAAETKKSPELPK